jgi:hypothetical protein
MADVSRKAQLTAELLRLTQLQSKALEGAVYLGWNLGPHPSSSRTPGDDG